MIAAARALLAAGMSVVGPVSAQGPDTTLRVFDVLAPAHLVRTDTVTGQSCDGSWGVCFPPTQGLCGRLILVDDGLGGREACTPESIANASDVAGNVAVIARGNCEFGLKALHAEAAGAIGFVIYNHDLNGPPEDDSFSVFMGGGSEGSAVQIAGAFWPRYLRNALLPALLNHEPVDGRLSRTWPLGWCTVVQSEESPGQHEVRDAEPNPFATTTQFGVYLLRTQRVTVEVFNTLGQRVALLHDDLLTGGGVVHEFTLEASSLPSGVYLYRVTGEDFVHTNNVVLAR
jgi:hypothetical protein